MMGLAVAIDALSLSAMTCPRRRDMVLQNETLNSKNHRGKERLLDCHKIKQTDKGKADSHEFMSCGARCPEISVWNIEDKEAT